MAVRLRLKAGSPVSSWAWVPRGAEDSTVRLMLAPAWATIWPHMELSDPAPPAICTAQCQHLFKTDISFRGMVWSY